MFIEFQTWFKQQSFYANLLFVHGERLFVFDHSDNSFRIVAVQTAYVTWQHLHETLQTIECNCDCGECEDE